MVLPLIFYRELILATKLTLLFLAALSYHVGLTSPNPPPSKNDKVYRGQIFERFVRLLATKLCSSGNPALEKMGQLNLSFIVGCSLMLLSGALRVWCFKTLGVLFTFEVTLKPSHKLVTSGPYAYVRHPSYTAILLMVIGAALTCFAGGSFAIECHIMITHARWLVYYYFTMAVYTMVSLWRRGCVEDDALKDVFGQSWEVYKSRVPWKFWPGII
ncbi:hypothetical protein BU17DRAFT_39924 [Hysterangium stoloniferum]|nr:hypothetical protein BU17DRAFT_39924 [Hysterangium stoloniferum]